MPDNADLQSLVIDALTAWYEGERPGVGMEPERYVVCGGLAVLEHMRGNYPLRERDFITDRNQVKTGGPFISKILRRYGEGRTYAREGGRTTRGTRPAAEKLAELMNGLPGLVDLSQGDRAEVIDTLQGWLADRAKDYFNRQRIKPEIDPAKPTPQVIADILNAAEERKVAGAVAQHLVGAKLALRFTETEVENHSYTTADQQLRRPGDFIIGDTAFHVTVAPMPQVIDKCEANLHNGYRPLLVVRENRIAAAQQMAELKGLHQRIGILTIESFVGQNVEEMGEFGKAQTALHIRFLLEAYNERVGRVETDRSLLIEIPENLR